MVDSKESQDMANLGSSELLYNFPDELSMMIFASYTPSQSIMALRCSCKAWKAKFDRLAEDIRKAITACEIKRFEASQKQFDFKSLDYLPALRRFCQLKGIWANYKIDLAAAFVSQFAATKTDANDPFDPIDLLNLQRITWKLLGLYLWTHRQKFAISERLQQVDFADVRSDLLDMVVKLPQSMGIRGSDIDQVHMNCMVFGEAPTFGSKTVSTRTELMGRQHDRWDCILPEKYLKPKGVPAGVGNLTEYYIDALEFKGVGSGHLLPEALSIPELPILPGPSRNSHVFAYCTDSSVVRAVAEYMATQEFSRSCSMLRRAEENESSKATMALMKAFVGQNLYVH